jgi:serine protease
MATPHVAGVAALYLATDPFAAPSTVHAAVVNNASVDKLSNIGTGSPNRLLYSIFGGAPVDTPPTARFTYSCTGLACSFNGSASTDDKGITSYAWNFGDSTPPASDSSVNHTYASSGTFTVTLTVTDTAHQTGTQTRSVTVSDPGAPPCSACEQYTGSLSGTGTSQYQPNGTYYFSGVSGTHRGWLRGPANADFDLYLLKWNGFWWVTVARSESATSEEQIAYTGTPGFYVWRVYSFSGSGSYTFWLQRP